MAAFSRATALENGPTKLINAISHTSVALPRTPRVPTPPQPVLRPLRAHARRRGDLRDARAPDPRRGAGHARGGGRGGGGRAVPCDRRPPAGLRRARRRRGGRAPQRAARLGAPLPRRVCGRGRGALCAAARREHVRRSQMGGGEGTLKEGQGGGELVHASGGENLRAGHDMRCADVLEEADGGGQRPAEVLAVGRRIYCPMYGLQLTLYLCRCKTAVYVSGICFWTYLGALTHDRKVLCRAPEASVVDSQVHLLHPMFLTQSCFMTRKRTVFVSTVYQFHTRTGKFHSCARHSRSNVVLMSFVKSLEARCSGAGVVQATTQYWLWVLQMQALPVLPVLAGGESEASRI
jgi:hypothetical protein